MNRSAQLLDAARELARACFDAREAKTARLKLYCLRAKSDIQPDEEAYVDPNAKSDRDLEWPCWKTWVQKSYSEDFDRLPYGAWCDSCIERQKHHLAYTNARKRRGIALRRIQANYRAEVSS